jgi:hypothetical protein
MKQTNKEKRLCWSLAELSQMTGLSVGLLRMEATSGNLRTLRVRRRVLVTDADWQKYVSDSQSGARIGTPRK